MYNLDGMSSEHALDHFQDAVINMERLRHKGELDDPKKQREVQRAVDTAKEQVLKRMAW